MFRMMIRRCSIRMTSNQIGWISLSLNRTLTMHNINKNLYLCTENPRKIKIDQSTLKLKQEKENTKPIVLMLSWFNAKPNQINKYAEMYTNQGMDVLVAKISPAQIVFSIKSVEKFGQHIADILVENKKDYPEIFIHSFSAGGCVWGVCQRIMKRNAEKYSDVPKRVIGQIWDSAVHPSATLNGVPLGLFPENKIMRNLASGYLWLHLRVYKSLLLHFEDCVENFYNNLSRSPALIIGSKTDQLGTPEFLIGVAQKWRINGVEVTHKTFDDTEHVKHFKKYPEDYMKLVGDHWEKTLGKDGVVKK